MESLKKAKAHLAEQQTSSPNWVANPVRTSATSMIAQNQKRPFTHDQAGIREEPERQAPYGARLRPGQPCVMLVAGPALSALHGCNQTRTEQLEAAAA